MRYSRLLSGFCRSATILVLPVLGWTGCGDGGGNPSGGGPVGSLQQGKVAFASFLDDNFDIFVLDSGGGLANLTSNAAFDSRPAWSPDGGRIAFVSDRSGDIELYVMNADGSQVRQLTERPGFDDEPVWSPDGGRIAFVSSAEDGDPDLYVVDAGGGNVQRLSTAPGIDHHLAWSPDGRRIAFVSNRDGDNDIYTINASGSGERRLSTNNDHDDWPSWSPDGRRIAFETNRDGNSEIYTMNATGSTQTRLTITQKERRDGSFLPKISRRPLWSPDGERILFISTIDEESGELYVTNADGSGIRTRLTFNNRRETGLQWSPDAQQVLYVAFSDDEEGRLFELDVDGAGGGRLVDQPASHPSWR